VWRLRKLTFVCISLELVSLLINVSWYGSSGSPHFGLTDDAAT